MIGVSFLYPRFLLLLFLIPLFIFIYFIGIMYNKKKAVMFSNFEALERIYDIQIFSKNFLSLYLNIAVLCLIIFSIAGTVLIFNAKTNSFSYVIAIDNSDSMKTTDMLPDRLTIAKESSKKFIDIMPAGVEFGVLGFSGDARIAHNLDNNKMKIKMAIDSVEFGTIQGTNMYNAIITANKVFGDRKMKSVIIVSDGQLNVGDTYQIIRYANRNNLIINTIMVGTSKGGESVFNTTSKADKDILEALAFNTEGKFFEASELGALDEAFNDLAQKTDKKVNLDISMYLLIAALGLFCFYWIVQNLRFKTIP